MGVPIIALRNEKGSYNEKLVRVFLNLIIALRNEKGSYNIWYILMDMAIIIALRNEKGSYNLTARLSTSRLNYSTAK